MRGWVLPSRVWSPGKAQGSCSAGGHRRGEGWRGVNDSEPLLMPRKHRILGRVAVQGDKGWPLRCGRRRPGTITRRVDTAAPRGQRAVRHEVAGWEGPRYVRLG